MQRFRDMPRSITPNPEHAGRDELAATVVFAVAAVISIELTRMAGNVSLIWPANAAAAALLVRDGHALRLRAALSLWCVGTLANVSLGPDPLPVAGALTAANVFEIWLTTWLLRDVWRRRATIDLPLAGRILLFAGICAPATAAVPGALIVHTLLGVPAYQAAATWWQSSVCGAALVGPTIYLFSRQESRALIAPGRRHTNLAIGAATLVATPLAVLNIDHSFIVVATPLVLAALRMGALGTAGLCALAGAELVALSVAGFGPPLGAYPVGQPALPLLPMVLLLILPVAVGVAVDDRRRAIEARRASERSLRLMLEQSPLGMCVMTLDGLWELSNASLQRMLGYSAEELAGKRNAELSVAEEYAAGQARALQLLHGERSPYAVERRFRRRDGEWIWTRCTTTLMRDARGEPSRFIVQVESLAEQRRVEHELAVERERLAITLQVIGEAVLVTDTAGNITYTNRAAEELLLTRGEQMVGQRLQDVLLLAGIDEKGTRLTAAALCVARNEAVRREVPGILHRADGSMRYVQESAYPLRDPDGALNGVVVVLRDVRAEFEREQKLRREAEQDQLTGLANRRALEERVAAAIARCEMGAVATLLLIDLDHFKRVNDRAGHLAGDEILRQVASALRRSARSSDLIARPGGDEFVVVLEDCADSRARQIAEEILRNILAIRLTWNGEQYSVGASIGAATLGGKPFIADADAAQRWMDAADRACYAAKRTGGGPIRFESEARESA